MLRPLQMAHAFLLEVITKEDIVVDATMGNGHDTLFLAQLAKSPRTNYQAFNIS